MSFTFSVNVKLQNLYIPLKNFILSTDLVVTNIISKNSFFTRFNKKAKIKYGDNLFGVQ